MLSKPRIFTMPVVVAALTFLIPAVSSYAWERDHHPDRHYYRYHDRPSFGLHLSFVPEESFAVRVGPQRYYYYDGLYYVRAGGDYVIVAPPMGAVVAAIPPQYQPVVINGVTYYVDNGVYYVYTRYGYQVVPQPVTVVQAAPVIVTPAAPVAPAVVAASSAPVSAPTPAPSSADESFTVNIPGKNGTYTSVLIKRSATGFVGPQGEFYAEFPKVTQLQAMYSK